MVTTSELRHEVEELVLLLLEANTVVRTNAVIVRGNTVTWASSLPARATLWGSGAVTVNEYLDVLRKADYVCLLRDGAMLQLEFTVDGGDVASHRLCWIPCPVRTDGISEDEPFEDAVEALIDAAGRSITAVPAPDADPPPELLLRSPLRFDYDPGAQAVNHPGSHLTIVEQDCRIPVFGPLSAGHFIRMVFRHFYPDLWNDNEGLRKWTLRAGRRCVTQKEEGELFVDCRQGRELQ